MPALPKQREHPAWNSEPIVLLCERQSTEPTADGAVYIALVPNPDRLAKARHGRLHGDVVDALVDLMVELAENEDQWPGCAS